MTHWRPASRAQRLALQCPAQLLLFGGAAGSLKSETLLADAARESENARLRAILFRRSFPELEKSLIRRSRELYAAAGATYNDGKKRWTFPSGAMVEFAFLESDKDVFRYQGAEFSFLGFDESTHFGEFPIRYLTSRLRSTEPSLRLRIRLASNPGNVGHLWHRALFMGSQCAHCGEAEREPWEVRDDARWPSDGAAVGMTTCYVPGRVSDHRLLGDEYRKRLEALPAKFARALLEGCWSAYEGQHFDCWDPARMVLRADEIAEQPWWPSWVGVDYGFSVSEAVAYRFARGPATAGRPRGRTYVVEEMRAAHQTAADFARALWTRYALGGGAAQRRIQAWHLSPECFADRGEGHTLADQMRAASGIGFAPAAADRVGGAMLLYSMLASGELVVSERCPGLIEALPTRLHDPKRPDDVLKVAGDPLDDCYDAARYGLYSFAPAALRPTEEVVAEAVRGAPDATQAMLRWRRETSKLRRAAEPQSYARTRRPKGR